MLTEVATRERYMTATIELDEYETKTLREVLQSHLGDLGFEISGTDRKDYRDEIKEQRETLKRILDKLP